MNGAITSVQVQVRSAQTRRRHDCIRRRADCRIRNRFDADVTRKVLCWTARLSSRSNTSTVSNPRVGPEGSPMQHEDVAIRVAELLNGRSIATAESCTAGRVAEVLACVEEASEFLRGGVVRIRKRKRNVFGVSAESVLTAEAAEQMTTAVARHGVRPASRSTTRWPARHTSSTVHPRRYVTEPVARLCSIWSTLCTRRADSTEPAIGISCELSWHSRRLAQPGVSDSPCCGYTRCGGDQHVRGSGRQPSDRSSWRPSGARSQPGRRRYRAVLASPDSGDGGHA